MANIREFLKARPTEQTECKQQLVDIKEFFEPLLPEIDQSRAKMITSCIQVIEEVLNTLGKSETNKNKSDIKIYLGARNAALDRIERVWANYIPDKND